MIVRRGSSDASFVTGLLLGLVAGAALVVVLTPEFRTQVRTLAAQMGVDDAGEIAQAAQARDEVLSQVAPPPDPRSSEPAA